MWNIVVGPPGTGKTTFLLKKTEELIEKGYAPDRIGYLAFTRKAANEALSRATQKFNLDTDDLPHFRTIHSLCYQSLKLGKADVMAGNNFRELGEVLGEKLNGSWNMLEGAIRVTTTADKMLFLENTGRNQCLDHETQYNKTNPDFSWMHYDWFCRSYKKYKETNFLLDYTDMLEKFIELTTVPKLDVLIVDEAQDLSALQWRCITKLAEEVEHVYIAGDDDQAIFKWAGADVEKFINLEGNIIQLTQSYRIPKAVHKVAEDVIKRVKERRTKKWIPREEEGSINYHRSYEHIDFSEGEWLILARNNYLLNNVQMHLRSLGYLYQRNNALSVNENLLLAIKSWEMLRKGEAVSFERVKSIYSYMSVGKGIERGKKRLTHADTDSFYTMENLKNSHGLLVNTIWHEAFDRLGVKEREYLISCLRRNENTNTPRIKLTTIHASKGGEADNVVLLTDVAGSTWEELTVNPDTENRTFYVGITRTKENLHVIQSSTNKYFTIAY
jgi:DNA helicase-2/ATP-dependent DNA helicase PcrA